MKAGWQTKSLGDFCTVIGGKNYLTDVATAETLLRLVQSAPSPKTEPRPASRW